MIATLLSAAALLTGLAPEEGPSPAPTLTPAEVVQIQLDALRLNDKPTKDAGIAITFRFASPSNRQVTGPLDHFARIVRGPQYLPMIDHRIAGTGPIRVIGNLAAQRVAVVAKDGRAIEYEFRLSKDPATGCWFTDGVVPIAPIKPLDEGVLS